MLDFEYGANEDVFSEAFDAFVTNGIGNFDWNMVDPNLNGINEERATLEDQALDPSDSSLSASHQPWSGLRDSLNLAVSANSPCYSAAPIAQMSTKTSTRDPAPEASAPLPRLQTQRELQGGSPGCRCLLRYAGLITRLKENTDESKVQKVDKVLLTLRHAQESWNSECGEGCSRDSDVDVLTALVLSVRYALRTLGKLRSGKPDLETSASRSPMSFIQGDAGAERSLLGVYEISQDEYDKVGNVLVRGSLNRIMDLLEAVAVRASRLRETPDGQTTPKSRSPSRGAESQAASLEHLHLGQLLEDTRRSLTSLNREFE
ncbi:Hypothetical predicted protein [Lecanosticta acicola]|uniref:Aflatoxin regulatory protein domain-containing protein n=1 Tax=Lecanosticta acicola TaxID=111012 RepID=A0AAI8Z5Z9_9PEZI|nr:Hypothetical predicted protein [Lecanosticta acicola]